jgi:hypothetical protein
MPDFHRRNHKSDPISGRSTKQRVIRPRTVAWLRDIPDPPPLVTSRM